MKLTSFTVENFRSIKEAYKITLNPTKTVLVGPNNAGKSNLLNAFALGLNFLLTSHEEYGVRGYFWENDFPLDLQKSSPDGASVMEYEFELDKAEKNTFQKITGSTWDSTLKVKLKFRISRPDVEIKTKGRAKKVVNQKKEKILEFLNKHLVFHSVPAVRTADLTKRLVSKLIFQELLTQKKSKEYLDLQSQMEKLEAPILKGLADKTKEYLKNFSTQCESISFRRNVRRYSSGETIDLIFNDGVETLLEAKGDGIQSLAAIAMIVLTSETKAKGKSQFCTIEEPESHLHPKAVHEVVAAINKIAENVQTIISTHSPLLVDRDSISKNIVVENGKAEPAKNISQLRDLLGIQRTDNLELTRVALLCEGDSDKIILEKWLKEKSNLVKKSLESGVLIIVPMRGVNKLEYQLNSFTNLLCGTHVFVDYDQPAKEKIGTAIKNKRLSHADYNYAKLEGYKESEIEDLINPDVYVSILDKFGIDVGVGLFKNKTKKWTSRIEEMFGKVGKDFSDDLRDEIKNKIAKAVEDHKTDTLLPTATMIISSLVKSLESKIGM